MPTFDATTIFQIPFAASISQDLTPDSVVRALTPSLSARRRERIETVLDQRLISVTVVLEEPYDPHNAAAVLRTAETLGLLDIHIIRQKGPFQLSQRVTQHADKWLNIFYHASSAACLDHLERVGYRLYAALPPPRPLRNTGFAPNTRRQALKPLVEIPLGQTPSALIFGNEHAGVSDVAIARAQEAFSIPMHGFSESLNLSVSAALALYDTVRARRAALSRKGDLPPAALAQLRAAYYARSVQRPATLIRAALTRANAGCIPPRPRDRFG